MFWGQSIQFAIETDVGLRRKNNEDAAIGHICNDEAEWRKSGHLFVVADGMGGHAVGELASRMAVEIIPHTHLKSSSSDIKRSLCDAIVKANDAIHTRGTQNQDFLHMGTTCTTLSLSSKGAIVAHIGDSRAYRIRRDRIDQLTFDHSLEWEMERQHGDLRGVIDLSQHRNVITRSLGPEAVIDIDVEGPYPVFPGDTFVLCSDGLSNQVTDEEIGAVARELSPRQAARLLVHLANVRGGPDNTTVVVARVGDLPANIQPEVVEEEVDDRANLDWSWLVAFWAAGMVFVLGLGMIMTDKVFAGEVTTAMGALGFIVILILAIRRRRSLVDEFTDHSKTLYVRPHRTAVCMSSKQLFQLLASIDLDLTRSAQEDGWSVKWEEHAAALEAAQRATKENRFGRGVRDLARAIDCIMTELKR